MVQHTNIVLYLSVMRQFPRLLVNISRKHIITHKKPHRTFFKIFKKRLTYRNLTWSGFLLTVTKQNHDIFSEHMLCNKQALSRNFWVLLNRASTCSAEQASCLIKLAWKDLIFVGLVISFWNYKIKQNIINLCNIMETIEKNFKQALDHYILKQVILQLLKSKTNMDVEDLSS